MEIKPTYVTFEQAKLLKDNKFDVLCNCYYFVGDTGNNVNHFVNEPKTTLKKWNEDGLCISAPEQWQVIEWLRVNHDIWITSSILKDDEWHYLLRRKVNNWNVEFPTKETFNSPQEAYSKAFDYIFEKLI